MTSAKIQFDLKTLLFVMALVGVLTALVINQSNYHSSIHRLELEIDQIEREIIFEGELERMKIELTKLSQRYGPTHPTIQSIRQRIDMMEKIQGVKQSSKVD